MATRVLNRVKPRKLTIDRDIDDTDIWHVRISTPKKTFNMPVGKSDLESLFNLGQGDWDCKVIGRFIKGSPLNFIKYE